MLECSDLVCLILILERACPNPTAQCAVPQIGHLLVQGADDMKKKRAKNQRRRAKKRSKTGNLHPEEIETMRYYQQKGMEETISELKEYLTANFIIELRQIKKRVQDLWTYKMVIKNGLEDMKSEGSQQSKALLFFMYNADKLDISPGGDAGVHGYAARKFNIKD